MAAGSYVLNCGAVCVACSRGSGAVAVRPSVSAVMKAGLTLSVDTVTSRPFMAIRIVFRVRARSLTRSLQDGSRGHHTASYRRKTWVESARSLWTKTAGEA